jgi:peptide deformylase
MYAVEGMGLSAVQVGVLQRIFIVDPTGNEPCVLINPRLLESSGEQTDSEGCLSVPGKHGAVTRPSYVKVKAYDADMQPFELEATELLARAICHEMDHLDGKLYVDLVEGELKDNTDDESEAEV